LAAALAVGIAILGGPSSAPARAQPSPEPGVDAPSTFEAAFATADDFYDRFDFGFSGVNQLDGSPNIPSFHGDHDMDCNGPTTGRTVNWVRDPAYQPDMFWHCAPGGDPSKGHLMTGINTFGYDIVWFSPRQMFSNVSKVCWDLNANLMSVRKWTQVLFVDADDATRYPSDKGSGGFDLGYTSPDFREGSPNTGIFPQSGTLAGIKDGQGNFNWFQDQDTWTSPGTGWPGRVGTSGLPVVTDKAPRYTHCLENQPGNTLRLTEELPPEFGGGERVMTMTGQIPQHPVRVVFQDDNYDPPKDEKYSDTSLTWHWDDIQIQAVSVADVPPPPESSGAPTEQASPTRSVPAPAAASPVLGSAKGDGGRVGKVVAAVVLGGTMLFLAGLALGALLQRGRAPRTVDGPSTPDRSN
jgi:hypothetical protein